MRDIYDLQPTHITALSKYDLRLYSQLLPLKEEMKCDNVREHLGYKAKWKEMDMNKYTARVQL